MSRMYNPSHPGRVLKDILEGADITISKFAKHLGVTRVTISRIINGNAGVTPVMSIRLAQAFGQPSLDIWFKMQAAHDFWQAEQKAKQHASVKTLAKLPLKNAA